MPHGRLIKTDETSTGRNTKFLDTKTNETMTRAATVKKIENGEYSNYHIRKINGTKTPVSNPDKTKNNNLG